MNLQRLKFLALFVLCLGYFCINTKLYAQVPTQAIISLGNPNVTCDAGGVPTSVCVDIQITAVDNAPWGLGNNNVWINFDPTVLQVSTFADAPFIHSGPPMTPSDPGLAVPNFLNGYTQDNAILDNAAGIIYTGLVYEGATAGGLQITTAPTTMSTVCFDVLDASKLNDAITMFLDDPANTAQVILHNTGSANSPDISSFIPGAITVSPTPSFSCPGSTCPTASDVSTFTGSNLCSTVLGATASPTVTISGANAASGVHSWSVTPNTGVSISDGATATPTITFPANSGCDPVQYTVTDNVTCDGNTVVARVGTYTVYAAPQAPTVTLATQGATCTYTLTPACATDVVSPSTVSSTTAGTAASVQSFNVSNGGCSATAFDVTIPACPNETPTCPTDATLTSGNTSLCGTNTNTIAPSVALVGTGTVTYSWTISPLTGVTGISGTTTAAPSATLPVNNTCNPIDYTVTATVKCTGMTDIVKTATYTVYPAPQAPTVVLATQGATCTYTLTAACAGDVLSPATISTKNAGDAASTVSINVQTNGAACSQDFNVSVPACPAINTCTPPAAPSISATATDVCNAGTGNPQSVTLSTNPTAPAGYGYLWSNSATTATISVTAATAGTFTVKFVKTDDPTCLSSDSAPLTVTAIDCGASCPAIAAPTIASTSCVTPEGSLVALSPNGGNSPYHISLDGGTTTGPADDLDTLLNANATIILVDADGCKSDPVDFTLGPVEITAGTSTLASTSICDTVPVTEVLVTNTGATPGVEVDFILTSADNADIIVGVSTDGTFDFSTGYPFGGGGAYPLGNYCFTAFAYRQSELDAITNNPIIKGLLGLQGGESLADVLGAVNGNPSLDSVTITGVKGVLGLASSFVGFTPCVHNEATGHCFELKECTPGGGCPTINAPDIAGASCVTPDGSLVALSPNGGNAPYSISLDNGVTLGPSGDLDTLLNASASIILVDADGCKSAAATFTLGPVEMNAGTSTLSITELCDTATTQVFVTNSGATPGVQVDFIITQPDAGDIIVGVSTDGTFDFTTGYPFGGGGAYPITQYCVTAFAYRQSELDVITNNLTIKTILGLQGGETLEEVLVAVNTNEALDSVTITGVKGVLGLASSFVGFTPCVHNEATGHCFDLKTCTSTPVCNPTTPTATSDVAEVCMSGTGSPTTATITAATAPTGFGYLWSNGATTVSITAGAGTYTVKYVKTDDITCQSASSGSVVITEKDCTQPPTCTPPAAPIITPGVLEVCTAGTGTPTNSTLSAGTAPTGFGYLWSTDETTQNITVGAGSYTVKYVKIGDATCQSASSSSVVITEKDCTPPPTCNPTTPTISAGGAEVCMAGTGTPTTVTITASAAPSGFGYLWSNGATTVSIDAAAGSYTVKYVKIGDATCQSVNSNSITISEVDCTPPDPCAGVTISGSASYDCTTGLALTGSGGTAPYTFTATKSGGSVQSVANGSILSNGTYTITVKDKNNCSATLSATLTVDCTTNPCEGVNIVVTASHSCTNGLSLSATGGSGSYTYFIDGFQVSNGDILGNGSYTVEAVSGGCSGSTTELLVVNCVVDPCAGLTISGTASYSCANGLAISGSGGSAPYSYTINGQSVANGSLLNAGTYTVTVKDKNNCTGTITGLQVANCDPCAGVTISGTASYNCETGLSLSAQGGTAPYTYIENDHNISNGSFLANGTYSISIFDANGCSAGSDVALTVNCQVQCNNTATLQTTQVELCDNSGEGNATLNLNTLVTGTQGGTWSVLGCSGCLSGSTFNASGVTVGNYTATYTVTGTAPCPNVSASLIVKVKDCNKPPVANPDEIVIPLGTNSITIDVTQNDSDPEGTTVTVTNVEPLSAGQGTVTISGTGDLVFTPGADVVGGGEVVITYTISDGTNSSTTTLTITISNCLANAGNLTASPYNCYEDGIKAKATGYKMGFTQTYILTDNNGVVLDYAANGMLDPGASGEYNVYALNYDGTLPINLPAVGQNISGLDGECFDLEGPKSARLLDTIVISHTAYCKPGYPGYYFVCIQVEGGFPDFANAGSYHFNFPPAYIPFVDSLDQGQICDVGPIPNGAKLTIDIKNDGYLCTGGPYTITGPDECACDPMAGAMSADVLYVCSGDDATATHTLDPIVGENEVLIYVLHTNANDVVGTIIDVNLSSPTFGPLAALMPLGVAANTVYYISAAVGADADGDGLPDFDECTKIAPGTPVVFLNPLMVEHTPICNQPEEGQYVIQVGATGGYAEFAGTDYYIDGVDFNNLNFSGNIILGPRTSGEGYNFNVYDREDQATACPAVNASTDAVPCKNTPIELLSFTGEVLPNGNLLKWVTASEIDNDYFTVMRSVNGVNFEKVGEIVDGAGNSTTAIAYDLLDKDAPAGLSYYRLDQTDFNGTVTQSNVITLERGETNISIMQVLPIPAIESLTVAYNAAVKGNVEVHVYDVFGKLVATQKTDAKIGLNTLKLNVAQYAAGVYFVSLNNGINTTTTKFIKK